MECRVIDSGKLDAYSNMAIDEALLRESVQPVLRFYQWRPKAVSVGYNQNAQKDIDLDFCRKKSIGIVRRITGGKAVLHDKELTYSFIVPNSKAAKVILPNDVTKSYKIVAGALVHALKNTDINAEIQKTPERIATPVCFNSSNWYELTVDSKKISGSAQKRFDGTVLQHGSILLDFDFGLNAKVFKKNNEKSIAELRSKITSIKHEKAKIGIHELKEAIVNGFSKEFNFKMKKDNLTEEEIKTSEKLRREKYSTDGWNFQKSG